MSPMQSDGKRCRSLRLWSRPLVDLLYGAIYVLGLFGAPAALADAAQDCQHSDAPDLAIQGCTAFLMTAQGERRADALLLRGYAFLMKNDVHNALKDINDALGAKSNFVNAYLIRGNAYEVLMADDPSFATSALADLDRAVQLKPDLPDTTKKSFVNAYAARGVAHLDKGEDALARSDLQEAIRLAPDLADNIKSRFAGAYVKRGRKYIADGQYHLAVAEFERASSFDRDARKELTPYIAEARSGHPGPYLAMARGQYHEDAGSYSLAVGDFSEALRLNPKLIDASIERAIAYWNSRDYSHAFADFDAAAHLNPRRWDVFYERAGLYESVDKFDEAEADYARALAEVDARVGQAPGNQLSPDEAKKKVVEAQKALEFNKKMEAYWVSYLQEIESSQNYVNWPEKPYGIYLRNHGAIIVQ